MVGEGLQRIEDYAFDGCSSLQILTLPVGLESIGNYAFSGCGSLQTLNLPKNLISIGINSFTGCRLLRFIPGPEGALFFSVAEGGRILLDSGLQVAAYPSAAGTITLPAAVTGVLASAFAGCADLTGISFPEGLTTIQGSAFADCTGLLSVDLPASLTGIGPYAFRNCLSLNSVTLRTTTPPVVNANSFNNTPGGLKFYVPAASVAAYKNASAAGKTAWRNTYADRITAMNNE
jgi:hypothetical protein